MSKENTDYKHLQHIAVFFYDKYYNLMKRLEIDRHEVINQAYIAYYQVGKQVPYVFKRLLNWLQRMNSYSRWYKKSYQDNIRSLQTILEENQYHMPYPELLVGSEDETIDQLEKKTIMVKFTEFLQASSYTKDQQRMIMRWLNGDSQKIIADAEGVSPAYVSRTKERAIKGFKQHLEGGHGESI